MSSSRMRRAWTAALLVSCVALVRPGGGQSEPITVTAATFEREVLKAPKLVMVDFWASWCGPCRRLGPLVERAARERTDLKVARVDVDANPQLAAKYEIESIPTLMFFRNGQYVSAAVGAMSYEQLTQVIDRAVKASPRERTRGAKPEIVGEFSKYPKKD